MTWGSVPAARTHVVAAACHRGHASVITRAG